MKTREAFGALVIAVGLLVIGALLMPVADQPAYAAVPTTVPTWPGAISGDAVSMDKGGTFFNGVGIDATEDEAALTILTYDDTDALGIDVQNSSGTSVFSVDALGAAVGVGFPQWATAAFTYTADTGFDAGTVVAVPVGELWGIHSVLVNVTTDVACTGDDSALLLGDATNNIGFMYLADAELQKADTEDTGFAAGWQGMAAATMGPYLDLNHNTFVYDNRAGTVPITVTATLSETSGTTITTGEFTVYVNYTKIED